jgi:general stress protein 26
MPRAEDGRDATEVDKLLAGAANTIARVRYCWLVTEAEAGGANARPMGRLSCAPDRNDWTIRFIADGRSRKASDIRRAGRVAVIFQHQADDGFVTSTGRASLRQSAPEVRQHWKDAYNKYFSSEADRANAAFIEVAVEHMELWIRGVTSEPFGLHPTVLERDAEGTWCLLSR